LAREAIIKIVLSKLFFKKATWGGVGERQSRGIFIQIIKIKGIFKEHHSKTPLAYVSYLPEHKQQRSKRLPSMVMFSLVNSPQVLGTRKGYILGMTYVLWYCPRFLKHSRSHFEIIHQIKKKKRHHTHDRVWIGA